MPYIPFQFITLDGKDITPQYRSLKDCLSFCTNSYKDQVLKNAKQIEVYLEGDRRKNICIFLAVVLIKYNDNKETHYTEIKIGEIN